MRTPTARESPREKHESPGVPRLAAVVAYEHHMKHNLSGYPAVAVDWRQSLCSEMTAISDFFDALRLDPTADHR